MINMDHHEQLPKEFPSFSISQEELTKLVQENNFASLQQSGGVQGIAAALETDLDRGLCDLDKVHFHCRLQVFGSNFMFEDNGRYSPKGKGNFCGLIIIDAMKDTTILLLLCCAILSFVLGVKRNGLKEGILDGLVMLVVILTVFYVSRIITFLKDKVRNHHQKVSKKRKAVSVLRDGRLQEVSVSEVVVGDVVFFKKGNQAPADGLFVRGDRLKLDDDDHDHDPVHDYSYYSKFPSILSGAKVVSGNCSMLVISVGSNTEASKMMRLLKTDQKEESSTSKLKTAIDKVNSRLEKIGLTISLLALLVQVLRCFIWSSSSTGCAAESSGTDLKGMQETVEDIMSETRKIMIKKQGGTKRFVQMLCVLVFALRDGLPLGLLISFYAFKKLMIRGQALIRNLPVCGSIGLVTSVCFDKTNDMSLEPTKMADLHIGLEKVNPTEVDIDVLNALREGIGTNTSDSEEDHRLLFWAKQVLGVDVEVEEMKRNCNIKALDNLNKNRTGSLVTWNNGSEESKTFATIYWKGDAEIILPMCTNYFDVHGNSQPMDKEKREHEFKDIVEKIAADDDSLSCVAFACRKVEEDKEEVPVDTTNKFTLLGFVSLKNPYTLEVKQAIKKVYEESGAEMKLILKEDFTTARLMATNLGILNPEEDTKEEVVEATVFRNSSEKTRELMVSNIKVLANASPLDKLLMIQCLRQKGEVVAATGRHTMDSPSLKEADVGLSMGDKSSEMARENSDIVILDNNLSTVVGILQSGRSLWQNIQKIIQLLLTLQIAAFSMNLIGAVFFSEIPLEPFQLMWFNFIMDVLGALVLTVPILRQEQVLGASTLITKTMGRNILVQVVYQVSFFLAIQLKGKEALQENQTAINAIVFNTFVLCQVFVLINAREIEKPNVLEGMMALQHRNKYWFLVIVLIIFALQISTVEIIRMVNHGERIMNLKNWCVCIGIATMSLPIGLVAKLIPWP